MHLTRRYEEALVYASRLHVHRMRPGTSVPHIAHLLRVSAIALEHGANEDEAIAALLHDTMEGEPDPSVLFDIRSRFGDAVADIVAGVGAIHTEPHHDAAGVALRLTRLPDVHPSVLLVATADRVHAVETILSDYRRQGEVVFGFFPGGKAGLTAYYRALFQAYSAAGMNPLANELGRLVVQLEQVAGSALQPLL